MADTTKATNSFLALLSPYAELYDGSGEKAEEIEKELEAVLKNVLQTPAGGKWSGPVQRITGAPTTAYHAIAYTDMPSLLPALRTWPRLDEFDDTVFLDNRISKNPLTWKTLRALLDVDVISTFCKDKNWTIPTVEEIRFNIADKKAASAQAKAQATAQANSQAEKVVSQAETASQAEAPPSRASVTKAVESTFSTLCKLLAPGDTSGAKKFLKYVRPFTGDAVLDAFHEIAKNYPDFEQQCEDGDVAALIDDVDWTPLLKNDSRREYFIAKLEAAEGKTLKEILQALNHVTSFLRVRESIPQGMLSEIEKYTTGLMSDLQTGKQKMEDLSLEKIGEAVLGQCGEGDITHMGNNLDELLPILQRSGIMNQAMSGMAGVAEAEAEFSRPPPSRSDGPN